MLVSCAAHYLCHTKLKPGDGTSSIINAARSVLKISEGDRELSDEINKLCSIISGGELLSKLKKENYLE